MTDRLLVQSIDANYKRYLDLARPVHEQYATTWHADYQLFVGRKDPQLCPSWNSIVLLLEAFANGYRKVVWVDADDILVRPEVSVFDAADDTTPFHMVRVPHSLGADGIVWRELGWDMWGAGVYVANLSAVEALEWVWANRYSTPRAWHVPELWELNWLEDWVYEHPDDVATLDARFDWMPWHEGEGVPVAEAVFRGFHGIEHVNRFDLFAAAFHERYG